MSGKNGFCVSLREKSFVDGTHFANIDMAKNAANRRAQNLALVLFLLLAIFSGLGLLWLFLFFGLCGFAGLGLFFGLLLCSFGSRSRGSCGCGRRGRGSSGLNGFLLHLVLVFPTLCDFFFLLRRLRSCGWSRCLRLLLLWLWLWLWLSFLARCPNSRRRSSRNRFLSSSLVLLLDSACDLFLRNAELCKCKPPLGFELHLLAPLFVFCPLLCADQCESFFFLALARSLFRLTFCGLFSSFLCLFSLADASLLLFFLPLNRFHHSLLCRRRSSHPRFLCLPCACFCSI